MLKVSRANSVPPVCHLGKDSPELSDITLEWNVSVLGISGEIQRDIHSD